jgi:hypothetical protein
MNKIVYFSICQFIIGVSVNSYRINKTGCIIIPPNIILLRDNLGIFKETSI